MNCPIPNKSFWASTRASLSLHSTATVEAAIGYLISKEISGFGSGLGSSGYDQVSGLSNFCFDCCRGGFCGSLGFCGFGLYDWASQRPNRASATRHKVIDFITMASQQVMSSPDAVRKTEHHTCLYHKSAWLSPTPKVCLYQSNQGVNISRWTFANQIMCCKKMIIQLFALILI